MKADIVKKLKRGDLLTQGVDGVPVDPDYDYYVVSGIFKAEEEALQSMLLLPNDVVTKLFDNLSHSIVLEVDKIFWRYEKPEEDSLEGNKTLGTAAYVNDGFEWLTYETILNKAKFRKTNQERKVGLYAADVRDLQLWVRDEIPAESFTALCSAFFPEHSEDEVRLLSKRSWWWKELNDVDALVGKSAPYYEDVDRKPPDDDDPVLEAESQLDLVGSRAGFRIHLPRYAVLPYNYWDNGSSSNALGTNPADGKHPIPLLQLDSGHGVKPKGWSVWRTASRSSVMRLHAFTDPWPEADWVNWPFAKGEKERAENQYQERKLPRFVSTKFKEEANKTARYSHKTKGALDFSVKTGVIFVGFASQASANKDVIGFEDEWFVGCMRSDTIKTIEKLAKGHGAKANDIVVQTEIMMILERTASPKMLGRGVDGVALRDLTVLDKEKFLIPPLSIPFIDYKDMKTLTTEFAQIGDPDWCDFWQKNWAEALGNAKALFLVQYGMQHANPNVQNYLIEFSDGAKPEPPVRIVIRDVADALLVREVAWALFGENKACPREEDTAVGKVINAHTDLGKMRLPVLRYNFRSPEQAAQNETGSTKVKEFGPVGIQFLWQRFSTFYGGWKGEDKLSECPKAMLPKALQVGTSWQIAHSAAYVRTVEKALGVEFGAIRWDKVYDPDHHPDRYLLPVTKSDPYRPLALKDRQWEEDAALVVHDYFRDPGRANICAYHNRGWKDAATVFEIQVVDNQGDPMPLTVVHYKKKSNSSVAGMRITDSAGEIPFYISGAAASDFDFEIGRGLYHTPVPSGPQPWETRVEWKQDRVALETKSSSGKRTVLNAPLPAAPQVRVLNDPSTALSGRAVALRADAAADPSLSLVGVQFIKDGVDLGAVVKTSPYFFNLDTTALKNGEYDFGAITEDSAGTKTPAATVRIKIANPLPIVDITSPPDGQTIAGPAVSIEADAEAGAGMKLASVLFQLDGNDIGTTAAVGPHKVVVDATKLTKGAHAITAIATDTMGHSTTSAAVSVTVDNPVPTVAVDAPVDGVTIAGTDVELTATATAGIGMTLASVTFLVDGGNHAEVLGTGPYRATLDATTFTTGTTHVITAVAKDTTGQETVSAAVTVTAA